MEKINEHILYKKFLEFENKKNYMAITYMDLPIWEYSRMLIYMELQTLLKGLTPSLPNLKLTGKKQECDEIKKKYVDLSTIRHSDFLLMGNPRRILQEDGNYYDITTDFIPEILNEYTFQTIEDPFWALFPHMETSHSLPAKTKNISYLDNIEKDYFEILDSSKFKKERIAIHKILMSIANDVFDEFGVRISQSLTLCENKLLYFLYAKPIYFQLLKKMNPQAVMLFYHPHHSEYLMTMVAKELKIPVIEIQHGIIGEFEPIWHKYLNAKANPQYLPDYILGFSPNFINLQDMILRNKIKFVGYPFLDKKIKEYKSLFLNKHNHNILIISQANISDELSEFTGQLALLLKKNYPEYHIFYKLHPYELDKKFPNLDYDNVTIINDLKKDIYYYQSICDIQIGVYSTALYEGTQFNTSTIIVKGLMGWQESFDILNELKGVYLAATPQDVIKILPDLQKTPFNNNLWGSFSKKQYKQVIKEIIDIKK